MGTKNLMDAGANQRPMVFDDKTGQYGAEPRMDLTETLRFVHESYSAMLAAAGPSIHHYAMHFAVQAACKHMGWLPQEIAVAEQYIGFAPKESGAAAAG